MALNVVLVAQRQSPKGMSLSWTPMEGVAAHVVYVASRKLTPEELEAADALGGTDECVVVKLGADATSIVDDISPQGEVRNYGVAMKFSEGEPRSVRFRAIADGANAASIALSSLVKGAVKSVPARAPAVASPTGNTGAYRVAAPGASPTGNTGAYRVATPGAPATGNTGAYRVAAPGAAPTGNTGSTRVAPPAASPTGNTGAYRVAAPGAPATGNTGAYRVAAPGAAPTGHTGSTRAAPAAVATSARSPEEDALEARKKQQAAVRARRDAEAAAAPAEIVPPPSQFPLDEPFSFRMSGATQTWDGLRITWERDAKAAAYEILVSDHQLFGDELADALAGRADFTSATAVGPNANAVIDNVTPREARGWYLVLARTASGARSPHPFEVGDAQASGRAVAPFVNPNRTGELRAEVEGMLSDAREQWEQWQRAQDGGARREAKRLVADALLIFPNHPGAKALAAEME